MPGEQQNQQVAYQYTPLTVSTAVIVSAAPCYLAGIVNVDLAAQTNNVQAFDNAATATGQAVGSTLNALPGAGFAAPALPGIECTNGLVVKASGVPSGSGYLVLWRPL